MPRVIKKGSTNVTDYVFIVDATDGSPETGATITNFDLQYVRNGAAPSAKVDATALATTDAAHGDNQMIEIDATDQPGLYRVDWPDAAFASGVDQVICTVKATGFQPAHKEYQLVDYDPTDTVRLGLTALPNAAADAAGGLPISDLGGLDMDAILADTNELQSDNVPGLIAALNDPTAASIADAVWDEAQADHVGAGSFGEIATETAAILVDTGTSLDTKLNVIDTVVDGIEANVALILADTGTDGVVLSAATQNAIADALLDRDMSTGTDSGSTTVRTPRQALRFLRNKWSISGTTLTVTKEDDATASWTSTVTATAGADPITANDPAGP